MAKLLTTDVFFTFRRFGRRQGKTVQKFYMFAAWMIWQNVGITAMFSDCMDSAQFYDEDYSLRLKGRNNQ